MTTARQRLLSLQEITYYHSISHCVRHAWLCRKNPYNGKSFEHRREWVLDRIQKELPIDLKIPWNISLKYWHMIENHDAVRTSPHPTTFANIRGMLLQHPPRGEGVYLSSAS
jgi:hypothetical protein